MTVDTEAVTEAENASITHFFFLSRYAPDTDDFGKITAARSPEMSI